MYVFIHCWWKKGTLEDIDVLYTFMIKEDFRKLNQTLTVHSLFTPKLAPVILTVNQSQHHTCRCPSPFFAGTSAGIMLTICDLQRDETD